MNFNNMLKNKYLYYAAVALMVINVLGYVSLGSIECVLVLGGAAYLANHFTKNRTVDIFVGLFVSNILFGCGRLKEGFVEGLTKPIDSLEKSANKLQAKGRKELDNAKTQDEKKSAMNKIKAGFAGMKNAQDCEGDDKCIANKKKMKAVQQSGFF